MAQPESSEILADLQRGAKKLVTLPVAQRQRLISDCLIGVEAHWQEWCELAWQAKRIPADDGARAEDMLTAVLPTLRYLRLMHETLENITQIGQPRLPAAPQKVHGRWRVPVFPTRTLFDRLLFAPVKAHVLIDKYLDKDINANKPVSLYGNNVQRAQGKAGDQLSVAVVLGAGNVSSIPITDTLTKIFQENQSVLLKMNPVNEYVGPIFEKAFAPLIESDLLRIVYGGAEVGASYIASESVDTVHITGSDRTHDAIVWGSTSGEQEERKSTNSPLLRKPITSELGNVTPWIIVPGKYSDRQLKFQAESIVSSVTSNASFVCIATKMLITSRNWPQRQQFLDLIESLLAEVPARYAYYPGASERFERFADRKPDGSGYLPWTLRRDLQPDSTSHLFEEESFACVFGETALEAVSPVEFLNAAVDFANERMWGTLAAALTVPDEFAKRSANELDEAVDRLRYGTVGINIWPGIAFALMSTPWGAFPGNTLQDIQSGLGTVHNTYLLASAEKSVIRSPLAFFPKPVWFPSHSCPVALSRSLISLYCRPGLRHLVPLLLSAVRG